MLRHNHPVNRQRTSHPVRHITYAINMPYASKHLRRWRNGSLANNQDPKEPLGSAQTTCRRFPHTRSFTNKPRRAKGPPYLNTCDVLLSGYDGLDCCECDCVSTQEHTCGESGGFDCVDPSSSCVDDYVEAGTKTTVGVSANAYDTRPGGDSGDVGCGEDGCTPTLSRDGITTGTESRWACAQKLVPDGSVCEIEFTFGEPQDIVDVEVAFYKGDERSRTLEVGHNGGDYVLPI